MTLKSKIPALTLGLLVMTAAVAVGFHTMTGNASAGQADGKTYASTTHLENSSANGQVDELIVSSTGLVEWEEMPNGAEAVHVGLSTNSGEEKSYETFASATYEVDGDESGEYSYDTVRGDVLENTSWDGSNFASDENGETEKSYFPVKVTITVAGPDGETCEFTETHKVKTSVTNLTDPTIDGDSDVGGDIVMNKSGGNDGYSCVDC